MSRRIVITLTEAEAARLARKDWHISLGHGIRVPYLLRRAEMRIQRAIVAAVQDGAA